MLERIKFLASSLWLFLLPFIRRLMTEGGIALALAATQAVLVVEKRALAGESINKKDEAFKIIVEELRTKGITMAAKEINGAIEVAVIKLEDESK